MAIPAGIYGGRLADLKLQDRLRELLDADSGVSEVARHAESSSTTVMKPSKICTQANLLLLITTQPYVQFNEHLIAFSEFNFCTLHSEGAFSRALAVGIIGS